MCCSVFEVFVDVVNGVGVFDDVGFNGVGVVVNGAGVVDIDVGVCVDIEEGVGVDVGVGVVSVDVNLIRLFKNCTLTFII